MRTLVRELALAAPVDRVFALLHTPSAIRGWWSAASAIVQPCPGGLWAAAWGEDEDDPDYITTAVMRVFDPPRRIEMTDYTYYAKSGGLPFEAEFRVVFEVMPAKDGATLRVEQAGFPDGPEADAFYEGCVTGWEQTFAGIESFMERAGAR